MVVGIIDNTPAIRSNTTARPRIVVRARSRSSPSTLRDPPLIIAKDTPATVANRMPERPWTKPSSAAGPEPQVGVSTECAITMPRTARPRAASSPGMRGPGNRSRRGCGHQGRAGRRGSGICWVTDTQQT